MLFSSPILNSHSLPSLPIYFQGLGYKRSPFCCPSVAPSLFSVWNWGNYNRFLFLLHFPHFTLPRTPRASDARFACAHLGTEGSPRPSGSSPEGAGCRWWCCGPRDGSLCHSRSGSCCQGADLSGSESAHEPAVSGGYSKELERGAKENKSVTGWAVSRQTPFLFSGIVALTMT